MNQPAIPFTGGCVCGAIRYECSAEPILTFKCHCRDCQQVTGGGFVAGLLVAAAAFRLTKGQLRYHFTPSAAGGRHKRGFCADCGSRLTGAESDLRATGFVGVTVGSLDDPSWFRPQMDLFVADAQPWDQMDPAIPKYPLYPPSPKEG
ncbi:MAG: GFA family protein [Verrucomicrobiota bacterium]